MFLLREGPLSGGWSAPDKLLRNLLSHKASLRQLFELLPRRSGGWCAPDKLTG